MMVFAHYLSQRQYILQGECENCLQLVISKLSILLSLILGPGFLPPHHHECPPPPPEELHLPFKFVLKRLQIYAKDKLLVCPMIPCTYKWHGIFNTFSVRFF